MKTAIVYYSYEGSCALVAEKTAQALKADLYRIKTIDNRKRKGLAKYLWGGGQVFRHILPPLLPLELDAGKYDLVVLGTPVWAGSPAPAMVSFLSKNKITGKKLALYCCHEGGKGKVFEKLKALLSGNTVVAEKDFVKTSKKDPSALEQEIAGWVKTFNS